MEVMGRGRPRKRNEVMLGGLERTSEGGALSRVIDGVESVWDGQMWVEIEDATKEEKDYYSGDGFEQRYESEKPREADAPFESTADQAHRDDSSSSSTPRDSIAVAQAFKLDMERAIEESLQAHNPIKFESLSKSAQPETADSTGPQGMNPTFEEEPEAAEEVPRISELDVRPSVHPQDSLDSQLAERATQKPAKGYSLAEQDKECGILLQATKEIDASEGTTEAVWNRILNDALKPQDYWDNENHEWHRSDDDVNKPPGVAQESRPFFLQKPELPLLFARP